jgi:amino acid adenylation domain-containing protein
MSAAPQTLPDLLAAASRRDHGRRPGVAAPPASLTWAEVEAQAHGLARAFAAHGLARGDRVAVYLEPSVEQAVALFGIAAAGAIAVPVNPKLRDAQVAHVLGHSEARAVVTSPDKLAYLAAAGATLAGVDLVVTGAAPPPGAHAFSAWAATPRGPLPEVAAAEPAVILYTSGSTGLPKGIVQDHRNLVLGAAIVSGYLRLAATDTILGVLPLSFDYGLNQLLCAAWVGAALVLHSYLTPRDLAAAVDAQAATVLAGVPPMWAALGDALRRGKLDPRRLRTLRVLTNSGGRLYLRDIETLRQALPQAQLFSMYGLTEAFRSSYLPPAELERRPTSIGKAIPGVELLVIDPSTGRECAAGEVGELVHAGALVALGYWNDPAATARRFRPHPLDPARGRAVFSGDLVVRDADGFLSFVARADAQLKVGGHRLAPDEVETVIHAVAGIAQAVVVGVEDAARADTRLVAFVVAPGAADVAARVVAACKRALPSYMVPSEVRVLPALPTNANGKPDRAALRQQLIDEGAGG